MSAPRLLDLFCGAGGAAMGYHRAGFDVVGVDIAPQPRYPFEFIQADAMTFPLDGFDAIHASPPCQGYSVMRHLPWLRDREYPLLIDPMRTRLEGTRAFWVIENVMGARPQAGWLCGMMFGRPFFRHRLFETNFAWFQLGHPRHTKTILRGRGLGARARLIVAHRRREEDGGKRSAIRLNEWGAESGLGHHRGWRVAAAAMDIDWMRASDLSQAIPPAYTEFIGRQLLKHVEAAS